MKDQDVILSSPIKVNSDGNLVDCLSVTLVSPVKKFIRKTYKLQQFFMQAQIQQAELFAGIAEKRNVKKDEKDDSKEPERITENQVMQMLLASKVDIEAVLDEFERLALLGAVSVDEKKINIIQWAEISEEDKEGLMAKYLSFFISILAASTYAKD